MGIYLVVGVDVDDGEGKSLDVVADEVPAGQHLVERQENLSYF